MNSQIYCLKCKSFTNNKNEQLSKTKNNRNVIKANCDVCGSKKNKFIKNTVGQSCHQTNKKGDGIVNRIIDVLPEIHMNVDGPSENVDGGDFNNTGKYSFCGPGTKFDKRIKQGYKGVNILDQACLKHDTAYNKYSDDKNRNYADNELAKMANEIANNPNISEQVRNDAKMVAAIMSTKSYLGLGVDTKKTKNTNKNKKS